jgi:adenylate cyclase
MNTFLKELRARSVIKVGLTYLVVAWVVLQVADVVFPAMGLPDTAVTLALALLALGFPVVVALTWVFDLTPEGVRRTAVPHGVQAQESGHEEEEEAVPLESDLAPSIAVVPFPDLSAERDQEHFCDGLTEELLNVLTKIPGLRVASRTSCFALKNGDIDLSVVASKLRVANVLEGSVRKAGSRVRIKVQLTEVVTDSHLWSETYDRELDDIFAIQDDIAARILEVLRLRLGSTSLSEPTTESAEAYAFYLSGRGYILGSDKARANAEQMYVQAVTADPGFVRAWVQLALVRGHWAIYYGGGAHYREAAYDASEKALALAPDRADCHLARGVAHLASQRYSDAEAEFLRVIELDPAESAAYHFLGRAAYLQNRMEQALEYFERCTRMDPDDYESPLLALGIKRDSRPIEEVRDLASIGVERAERHLANYPDTQRAYYLGAMGLLALGEDGRAHEWADQALALDPESKSTRYNIACLYARAGRTEDALDLLENSITSRRWIEHDPDLDSLRAEPRYQALIASLPT